MKPPMSQSLIVEILLAVLALMIGVGSFIGASRANAKQAITARDAVDQKAYERAQTIYEKAIGILETQVDGLQRRVEALETQVDTLTNSNDALMLEIGRLRAINDELSKQNHKHSQ
jgi:cell division protein FtsB